MILSFLFVTNLEFVQLMNYLMMNHQELNNDQNMYYNYLLMIFENVHRLLNQFVFVYHLQLEYNHIVVVVVVDQLIIDIVVPEDNYKLRDENNFFVEYLYIVDVRILYVVMRVELEQQEYVLKMNHLLNMI